VLLRVEFASIDRPEFFRSIYLTVSSVTDFSATLGYDDMTQKWESFLAEQTLVRRIGESRIGLHFEIE